MYTRDRFSEVCLLPLNGVGQTLDPAAWAEFRRIWSTGQVEPRQCLFHEGDPARFVYSIAHGTMKLYRLLPDGRRQIAAFIHAGEFLALTSQGTYDYTAEALERVEFCLVGRDRLDKFVDDHPELGRELFLVAARKLAVAREQLVVLGRKTSSERLATALLELFDRACRGSAGREVIRLPMSRADLADYLGLTKETVSRCFTQFRKEGLIALIHGDRVELLDRARLEQLARGESG